MLGHPAPLAPLARPPRGGDPAVQPGIYYGEVLLLARAPVRGDPAVRSWKPRERLAGPVQLPSTW